MNKVKVVIKMANIDFIVLCSGFFLHLNRKNVIKRFKICEYQVKKLADQNFQNIKYVLTVPRSVVTYRPEIFV